MSKHLDKQPNIYEYATGNIVDRNIFETIEFQKELLYKQECHRSLYCYDDSVRQQNSKNGTDQLLSAEFKGKVLSTELVIEIDFKGENPISDLDRAKRSTIALVTYLQKNYDLDPNVISYEFSGNKGFHIRIPGAVFGGFVASEELPFHQKVLCQKITNGIEGIGLNIYKAAGMMRIPNTKHSDSELFAIPLEYRQLIDLDATAIHSLARVPVIQRSNQPLVKIVKNDKLTVVYKNILNCTSQYSPLVGSPQEVEELKKSFSNRDINHVIHGCRILSRIENKFENDEELHNEEITFLKANFSFLGPEGRLKTHEMLSKQPNYNSEEIDESLKSLFKTVDPFNLCSLACKKMCNTMKITKFNTPLNIMDGGPVPEYNQSSALNEVINSFKDVLIFKSDQNTFYFYEDGVFSEINEHDLHSLLSTCLEMHFQFGTITAKAISDLRKRMTMCEDLSCGDEMNPFPHILNLKNGMYDMRTGEFLPHSPEYRSTVQLNIVYDPIAKCELFAEKLNEIFDGDEDKIDYFKQWMLYCLMPIYEDQKFLILYGTGRNGKSLLTNVLSTMIGDRNCSHETLSDISTDKGYSLIHLKDKLVNFSMEMSTKEAETDIIKRLTGGDIISTREIYRVRVQFRNYARLIISTNSLPRVANLDKAFLGRMEIIEFTRSFVDNPDTELDKKLIKEIPGIFNLLMEIRSKIFKNDGSIRLQLPESLKGTTTKLSSNLHSVTEFISENCELIVLDPNKSDKMILMKTLYMVYNDWCKESGYFACGKKLFKEVLEANSDCLVRKLTYVNTRNSVSYKNSIWVLGIALQDDSSPSVRCSPGIRVTLRDNPDESISFNESSYLAELDLESLSHSIADDNSTVNGSVLGNTSNQGCLDDEFFRTPTYSSDN
jgi:P4 family phage/plasmid primase-like protien